MIEQSADGVGGWSRVGTTAGERDELLGAGPVQRVEHDLLPGPGFELLGWQLGVLGAPASTTTPSFPSVPTGLTATATSEGTITLAWADTAGEDGYRIERSTERLQRLGIARDDRGRGTSYTDTGRGENLRFYYRVVAINAVGEIRP